MENKEKVIVWLMAMCVMVIVPVSMILAFEIGRVFPGTVEMRTETVIQEVPVFVNVTMPVMTTLTATTTSTTSTTTTTSSTTTTTTTFKRRISGAAGWLYNPLDISTDNLGQWWVNKSYTKRVKAIDSNRWGTLYGYSMVNVDASEARSYLKGEMDEDYEGVYYQLINGSMARVVLDL